MPKIKINEYDLTTTPASGAINNVVYIPGNVASGTSAIDPKLFTSLTDFEKAKGSYDNTKLNFKLAKYLLKKGLYVLFEGLANDATAVPESSWTALSDKGKYAIRFLTNGSFANIDIKSINCAYTRGDAVALINTQQELTGDYPLYQYTSYVATGTETEGTYYTIKTQAEYKAVTLINDHAPLFIPYFYYANVGTAATPIYQILTAQPTNWDTTATSFYIKTDCGDAIDASQTPLTKDTTYYIRTVIYPSTKSAEETRKLIVDIALKDVPEEQLSYAAAFTPWVKMKKSAFNIWEGDSETEDLMVPASFAYLAAYANSLQSNPEWFAVAGSVRGQIPDLVDKNPAKYDYSEADCELLQARSATDGKIELDENNDNVGIAINPIANIRPFGYIIWGNRTLHKNALVTGETYGELKATSFLNVRNLVTTIKKKLYDTARKYTFDQNSDILWINFSNQITPMLDKMKSGEGILGYKFERVATTKKARLCAKLTIIPIEAVEDFVVDIYLTDSLEVVE